VTRIDLHAHVVPPAYRDQLPAGGDAAALDVPGAEQLLGDMDRWEIDGCVISMGGNLAGDAGDASLARLVNEGLAEIAGAQPQRLGAIASLPLPDVDAALAELEYALDTLGLEGVLLLSNHRGVYLGERSLDPLFEELDRREVYCFVHPDFPPSQPLPHPGRWYEYPFDTTRAMVHMALNGAFDRYPRVKLQWAHLGGTIPFLARRISTQASRMPDVTAGMQEAEMISYFRQQWYDTGLSPYFGVVAATQDLVPIERIVFGTDWPWFPRPAHGSDLQPQLDAVGPDRAKIDFENARELVPRLVDRVTAD
jgi:predicted TIM-barrel fold metal-dependent hydrolase